MKYFKPQTTAQKRKYSQIVTARSGQSSHKRQIRKWNHYAKRAYWYAFSPAKRRLHIYESARWTKQPKNKVKNMNYRLHSYFKRFTHVLATITDLQEELRWVLIRKNQLINPRVKNIYHHLSRNSDIVGAEIKDQRKRRLHHQYRSYAHRYIMRITRLSTLSSIKINIMNTERSKNNGK